MKRTCIVSLMGVAIGLAVGSPVRADDTFIKPRYLYFPARSDSGAASQAQSGDRDRSQANRTAVSATPAQTAEAKPVAPSAAPSGQPVRARPISWGLRHRMGSAYAAANLGQTASSPAPTPAYGSLGYSASSPGAAANAPMAGPSYKYSYAGRGPYYYGTAYNSGYYASGCYVSNACCRASRRYWTPFGGMCHGWGSGCYAPPAPPCPTTCAYTDPCYGGYAAPAYGTPTPVPTTAPPPPAAPQNYDNPPPEPVEKKVTPAPQASRSPRIPGLPPDA